VTYDDNSIPPDSPAKLKVLSEEQSPAPYQPTRRSSRQKNRALSQMTESSKNIHADKEIHGGNLPTAFSPLSEVGTPTQQSPSSLQPKRRSPRQNKTLNTATLSVCNDNETTANDETIKAQKNASPSQPTKRSSQQRHDEVPTVCDIDSDFADSSEVDEQSDLPHDSESGTHQKKRRKQTK